MSEWGYLVPEGETKSYWLTTATEDGKFNRGDVRVDTEPVGDLGNWGDSGVPMTESPTSYGMQGSTVRMSPEDFHDLQTFIGAFIGPADSPENFWRVIIDGNVEEKRAVLRGDEPPMEIYDGIPMPYVEIGSSGNLRDIQEGRHRAVAALKEGLETMPVRVIYNPDRRGESPRDATYFQFRRWRDGRDLPR